MPNAQPEPDPTAAPVYIISGPLDHSVPHDRPLRLVENLTSDQLRAMWWELHGSAWAHPRTLADRVWLRATRQQIRAVRRVVDNWNRVFYKRGDHGETLYRIEVERAQDVG